MAQAKLFLEEALLISRKLKAQLWIAQALFELGNTIFHDNHEVEGINLVNESLVIYKSLGNKAGMVDALARLGAIDHKITNERAPIWTKV